MKTINGSVCAPQGFLSAGVYAGLKKNPEKKDVGVIYSERPAVAAGVFTINKIKAAPLVVTEKHIKSGKMQAIVINSGNANACTGEKGLQDAETMGRTVANCLQISEELVGIASTGVIGVPLPIEKVVTGIKDACGKLSNQDDDIAHAILTTDTFTKSIAIECEIAGKKVRVGGVSKGSGMIHPMMATMLAFITTDAAISPAALQKAVVDTNEDSFHMITVDGDTSTNDMVLVLANGMAGNPEITDLQSEDGKNFFQALKYVSEYLAKQIALDGEGASKFVEIRITGAATKEEARIAARAVCRSSLVKAAIFGEDANWGRIASTLGVCGVALDPEKLTILLGDLILLNHGKPLAFDEELARNQLQKRNVVYTADLGVGSEHAVAWGCDLTYDYVKINASYRS